MHTQILLLIGVAGLMFLIIGGLAFISHYYTLNGIKSKTVGDGQHGTARWATKQEIRQTYAHIPFEPELWRQGKNLPDQQGLILGCEGPKGHVTAVVDTDDIHALVTAASGAGKTAFFLYPNIEYALATGMSFLCTDTKGDLFRNYAGIARECYGYADKQELEEAIIRRHYASSIEDEENQVDQGAAAAGGLSQGMRPEANRRKPALRP